jgi:hypothetical protein
MGMEYKEKFVNLAYGSLVGKTVSAVRAMTDIELAEFLWYEGEVGIAVEFTDGSFAIVSKDDEGNGAGSLFLGEYATARPETARQKVLGD